ncbi:MAG: hypothetical protein O2960_20605, partial [Verrucomicrobia bacterium]|nr:hypothetical protein [Verrucomicrobiota bacterium]
MRRESAEAKAERIISEELRRLGWSAADLSPRRKSDPAKLALANRLKRETIPLVKAIAERLHFGSSKSARERLRESKAACECQSSLLTRFCEQDKQFGMPRKPRLEYLGAIYHVMNRGDRREDIFRDEQDREKFLRTLTEACLKT